MNNYVMGKAIGAGLGIATAIGCSKLYAKKTGKAGGCVGSIAHVLSNPKIDNKFAAFNEINKESTKDLLKLTTVTGATAGVGALVTKFVPNADGAVKGLISKAGEMLSKVSVSGKNLKDIVKNTKVFNKFKALPTPAKAAIIAGVALFSIATPIVNLVSSAKCGYIEAKHETKVQATEA